MNILVVGNGGREHALVWKIAQNPRVEKIFCAPGNAGIASLAECVPIPSDHLADLKMFVIDHHIDLTVVGPEAPLALGIANEFRKAKLKIFGPTQGAAQIESSKAFAKDLMIRHGVPTATSKTFDALSPALAYLDGHALPVVIKADGLAQGKGVIIAHSLQDAREAVHDMLKGGMFGKAGSRVLIEQFLGGEEVSVMAFTDGSTVVPMVSAQDHKRVGEGDTGPNTGGMGAYAPSPLTTPEFQGRVVREVFDPVVKGLSQMGRPFQGVLYAGLMVVEGRPYVLEFNARFGDPETQVVLPLLQTDLVEIMEAVAEHRLDQMAVHWENRSAICVVQASGGYPGSYATEIPIHGLPDVTEMEDVMVFHAGTKTKGTEVVTAGGRVLGVTAVGPDLQNAAERVYHAVDRISFAGAQYRRDIGGRRLGGIHDDATGVP